MFNHKNDNSHNPNQFQNQPQQNRQPQPMQPQRQQPHQNQGQQRQPERPMLEMDKPMPITPVRLNFEHEEIKMEKHPFYSDESDTPFNIKRNQK